MKKLTTVLSGLVLATLGGFFFASCTNPNSPATTVGAPTNLMALSKDANTISIKWTRGANDTSSDTLVITNTSTNATTSSATSSTATSQDVNESEGIVYSISIHSAGGASSSINWMTAVRTSGLRLYQFSSNQKSGLQLNGLNGQATVVSALSSNIGTMDFYLEDVQHDNTITTTSGISFEGAQFLDITGETWRNSYIDLPDRYVVGGLDADYSATDFSTQLARITAGNAYDIPDDAVYATKGSRVLIVKTQDGNLAKIEVVPDPSTGKLYSGSGTSKYITVNVSYQPIVGQPYAARPIPRFNGREQRISAH